MDARRRLVRSTCDTGDSAASAFPGRDEPSTTNRISFISDASAPLRSPRRAFREFVRDEDYSARWRRPRRPRHPSREETPKPSVFRHRDQFDHTPRPAAPPPSALVTPTPPAKSPGMFRICTRVLTTSSGVVAAATAPRRRRQKKNSRRGAPSRRVAPPRTRSPTSASPSAPPGAAPPPREDDSRDSLAEVFEREPVRRGIRNVPGERRSDAGPQSPHRAAPPRRRATNDVHIGTPLGTLRRFPTPRGGGGESRPQTDPARAASNGLRPRAHEVQRRHAEHGEGSRRGSRDDWRRPHPPRPRRDRTTAPLALSRGRCRSTGGRCRPWARRWRARFPVPRKSARGSLLAQDLAHDVDRGRVGVALRGTEQTRHRGITRGGTSRGAPGREGYSERATRGERARGDDVPKRRRRRYVRESLRLHPRLDHVQGVHHHRAHARGDARRARATTKRNLLRLHRR